MQPTLPDFLIIGAQKAGSSWLARALRRHPDVFMPKDEIHFFDKRPNWKRGLDWYTAFFQEARQDQIVGEKTPDYLWANGVGVEDHLPDVHENIRAALPDAKLIAVLRDPVERAISAAKHILRSGRISPIHSLDELLVGRARDLVAGHGVLEYGRYAEQLEAYGALFGAEQMLVLIFEEDIVRDPAGGLSKVCHFLDLDPEPPQWDRGDAGLARSQNENTASRAGLLLGYYVPPLRGLVDRVDRRLPGRLAGPSVATRRSLCAYYREENERLFALLDRRIPAWQG